METTQGEGNKKGYIVVIIALLLLNGVTGYMLYMENRAKIDVTTHNTDLTNQVKGITDTLDAKKGELEALKGVDAGKDSAIAEQQALIEKEKQQILTMSSKGKMDKGELAKAQGMIAQYEASIVEMKKQIDQLVEEKKQLTNQNQQLNTDLSTEKKTTAQLSETNKGLSKKVELGSLLQLRSIMVEGTSKKKNGKEVVEKKSKRTESLRITFETGDNKVLEAGPLSLYLRILNPKGETISVADQGSGTLKNEAGETVQYTKKADFDWSQANKKIVVYWSQNIKDPGTYKVEIYQGGSVVGNGEVELK